MRAWAQIMQGLYPQGEGEHEGFEQSADIIWLCVKIAGSCGRINCGDIGANNPGEK